MFRFHSSLASLRKEERSLVVHPFPTTSMKLPARGSVSKLSGEPFSEGSVPWEGIFINSEPDSSVKAVGAGEIVFASDFNTLKNLVILDHGNNYLTLYGNLHSLNVSLGMLIRKDDIIGKSLMKGINHRGGIYFEIRKNGAPIDPKLWFKY